LSKDISVCFDKSLKFGADYFLSIKLKKEQHKIICCLKI